MFGAFMKLWIIFIAITVGIGSLKLQIKLDFIENKLMILTGRNPVLVFGINLNFIFRFLHPFLANYITNIFPMGLQCNLC